MNKYILAAATLALSAMTSVAQAQNTATPPAGPAAATPPRPATSAPATGPAAIPTPAQAFGGARNVATSPELARQAFTANVNAKQATCTGKGPLYKWVAPHTVGEPNPKGGFFSNTFGGGCRKIGLSEAIAKGAVTVRQ